MSVSIIIPALNEAEALPRTLSCLDTLDPKPLEVILADGGSSDATCNIARKAGLHVIENLPPNRAVQMNVAAEDARGDILCFLHADTALPGDFVALAETVLDDTSTALAGFVSVMRGRKLRPVTSAHNFIKTWYAPLFFRPLSFIRGCRLLFGDQVIICRRQDFEAIGGYDENQVIMEEAGLCLAMVRGGYGRVRQVNRKVWSSDRRVAEWGFWKANATYFYVGAMWGLGRNPEKLRRAYKDVR